MPDELFCSTAQETSVEGQHHLFLLFGECIKEKASTVDSSCWYCECHIGCQGSQKHRITESQGLKETSKDPVNASTGAGTPPVYCLDAVQSQAFSLAAEFGAKLYAQQ